MKKVALGLSGGVDSAVSAYLLKQQGYDVHCIYLNCFDKDIPGCRTKEDRKDALAVAMHLKLPFQVLDFRKEYQQSVIEYFKSEYEAGRTPNPDVVCNRDIKFGLFYTWAIEEQGFDYLATGHYAKLTYRDPNDPNGHPNYPNEDYSEHSDELARPPRYAKASRHFGQGYSDRIQLVRPKDLHKDQAYFLWQVSRERFERVLFPLGDFLKSEVREIAQTAKLPVAEKPDSTGICFIGEVRVEEFLKRLGVQEKAGEVVIRVAESGKRKAESARHDEKGLLHASRFSLHAGDYEVIGRHRGIAFYTIGQRHGFEINSKLKTPFGLAQGGQNSKLTDKPPLYVIEKDVEHNRLIVGFGAETYRNQFAVSQTNWLSSKVKSQKSKVKEVFVRIRHGGELIRCSLSTIHNPQFVRDTERVTNHDLRITVRLFEPQRGIAPGQSAVFYDKGGVVLGGGVIK